MAITDANPASAPPPSPNPPARSLSIGAFVQARRKEAGLTQIQLAQLVGTGTRFISELEHDKTTLRLDAVNRVLAAFGKQLGVVDRSGEALP
jgi:y4mF family transcriptional regulator